MKKIILPMATLALITIASCGKSIDNSDTIGSVPAKVVDNAVDEEVVNHDSLGSKVEDSLQSIEAVNDDLKEAISQEIKEKEEKAKAAAEELKEKSKEGLKKGADAVADKAKKISDKLSE